MEKTRPLSAGELHILKLIQGYYGQQNATDDVFVSDKDEAVIFVKDAAGTAGMCVVLTNVADWSNEEHLTDDQILQQYLTPQ